jgi:hypothetical protein
MASVKRDNDVCASRSRIDRALTHGDAGRVRIRHSGTCAGAARNMTPARSTRERYTGCTLDVLPTRPYPHAYQFAKQTRPSSERVTSLKDGAS